MVTQDFTICKSSSSLSFPALLLIAGLFGVECLDPVFSPFLGDCLGLDSSLGFVSGHRNSAYFVAGCATTEFTNFDPRTTKKAVVDGTDFSSYYALPIKQKLRTEI
jgi:hypothetical protein